MKPSQEKITETTEEATEKTILERFIEWRNSLEHPFDNIVGGGPTLLVLFLLDQVLKARGHVPLQKQLGMDYFFFLWMSLLAIQEVVLHYSVPQRVSNNGDENRGVLNHRLTLLSDNQNNNENVSDDLKKANEEKKNLKK